jgi:hypothetical protein
MADRKISDLTALTTPASGDFLPIVDISEAAAASKNKRITIEELFRGVPLGTAAAPSIAIEGDEDTGVFSPGANQLAVATNGTGRLFIDASGNVGVGLSNPSYPLEVASSTNSTINITGGTSNSCRLFFSDTTLAIGFINYDHADDSINIGTAGSERLRITSAGLVGIGSSAPGTNLHIGSGSGAGLGVLLSRGATTNFFEAHDGTKTFIGGTDNTNAFVKVGSLSNHPVAIVQANGSAIYIDTSQRVGIGTTSPTSPLAVSNGSNKNIEFQPGSTCYLFAYDRTASDYLDLDIVAENLIFSTSSERARIDSSGRLLVGASADSGGALLQVNGDRIRVATAKTPASAADTGTAGEICWDADYIYVCTATNTWKRSAIATW